MFRLCYQPILHQPPFVPLIASIGLYIAAEELFRIVFGPGAAYSDVVHRAQALFAADVEETIREGIASGAFAPLPPPVVAQAVIGMATQVLSWWTEHPSATIETLNETMTTLALCGLAPAAPREGDRR